MFYGLTRYGRLPVIFWALAATAVAVWSAIPGYTVGWDSNVYVKAVHSLQAGHDPYADAIQEQEVYHRQPVHHATDLIPYSYVYPPVTLPVLRLAGKMPLWLVGLLYWTVYAFCVLTPIVVSLSLVQPKERQVFVLLAPVVVFFPGLLQYDGLFNGNIAYVLYGMVFGAAWVGWRRGRWTLFYVVVLLTGMVKPPLLSLLAIPVMTARRQWLPAAVTAACGTAVFAVQPRVWPGLFNNFLRAVDLQFLYNHDFSSSPAGMVADALFHVVPYHVTSLVVYALSSVLVVATLWPLRRAFLAGRLTLEQWAPFVLLGTVLLNPRIMEYDAAPMTVAMALVAWRIFARGRGLRGTIVGMSLFFAAVNVLAQFHWKITECCVLVGLFVFGARTLWLELRAARTVGEMSGVSLVA